MTKWIYRQIDGMPHYIIEEIVPELRGTWKRVGFADSEHDARLIAAAPEMLRALKLSEKYLAKAVELGMMYDCVRSPRSVLDKVQAIIAATEGTDDQG